MNRQVIERCASVAERMRDRSLAVSEEAIAAAYHKQLQHIKRGDNPRPLTSLAALQRLFRDFGKNCLRLKEGDLCRQWRWAERAFPQDILAGPGLRVAVSYRYSPGDDDDGATVSVQEGELTRFEVVATRTRHPWLVTGPSVVLVRAPGQI